ncbi:MAG: Crp/Fnr family transcriptional regulator [Candidatus Eremiobacteraeota bacterium]|nr:Crp/Fnr family transcriptional regulator [Candidatus Eremiobacteraeota bacterium]
MRSGNRFLDALPAAAAQALIAGDEPRELPFGSTLVRRDENLRAIHFPVSGAISDIEEQPDGGAAETAAVGPEGLSGVELLLDVPNALLTRVIQTPTTAFAVPAERVLAVQREHAALGSLGRRYAAVMLRAGAITSACNARHVVTRRLARWVLRMADRLRSDEVVLTHDATSLMLGVRRSTVTQAMRDLQRSGTIAGARKGARILDRSGLETLACSCYTEERALYDALYA